VRAPGQPSARVDGRFHGRSTAGGWAPAPAETVTLLYVFRRRADNGDTALVEEPVATEADRPASQAPKGRPTPSRKSAQQEWVKARKGSTDPRARNAAKSAGRSQRRQAYDEGRQAMLTGDVNRMPVQHRGPVKAFTRDYVDSRLHVSEFALPLMIVMLILQSINSKATVLLLLALWVVLIVGIGVDWFLTLRGLRKGLAERFDADEVRGYKLYAVTRSLQFRKLRMPKPRLRRGEPF
jgi:hypothetical protein